MREDGLLHGTFVIVIILFSLILIIVALMSIPLKTRATANSLTMKLKLQGVHRDGDRIKADIDFYDSGRKVSGEKGVVFTSKENIYAAEVALKPDFDYTSAYALYVKPEKYAGKLFCGNETTGAKCTVPQFIFLSSGSTADLTGSLFYGGDTLPPNGKVDAADMSVIMKQLGKASVATDINSDGITDVTDYSLALYSLTQSVADDPITLANLEPTGAPTPSTAATATPGPTAGATATPAPSPTGAPSSTPIPTATPPPPTATTAPVAKCHISPPAGYGDPFDLEAGKTTPCGCSEAPLIGKVCSTITCDTCPSGTCNCSIGMQLPPYSSGCSNGGKMTVNKVASCN